MGKLSVEALVKADLELSDTDTQQLCADLTSLFNNPDHAFVLGDDILANDYGISQCSKVIDTLTIVHSRHHPAWPSLRKGEKCVPLYEGCGLFGRP
jgi:hypothetical protein